MKKQLMTLEKWMNEKAYESPNVSLLEDDIWSSGTNTSVCSLRERNKL